MAAGLESQFNILTQSPLDQQSTCSESSQVEPLKGRWVPSYYNIRATEEDGRLILWNTLNNSMTVFKAEDAPRIRELLSRKGTEPATNGFAKYLYDRGFLVKETADEFRQFQSAFGQQHYRTDVLELILLASEDCNFRCEYCYEDFLRGTMQPEVRAGIKRLVEKRLPALQELKISWFGGEPLYGWEAIEDLAPFFMETARRNALSFFSHMTTNGYLLQGEIVDKLLEWQVNDFQITIDGPASTHDQNRPARDGSPTFNTIFKNLLELKERSESFTVTIRVNFDRNNHTQIPELLTMVEERFAGDPRFSVSFRPVGKWGGPNDENLQVCGTDEGTQVEASLRREAHARGFRLGTIRDVNRLGGQVCYAARPYNLLIGATGKIMKCTIALDKEDHNVVGKLNSDGEVELDADKFALWTEPAYQQDTQCQKCVVLPSCQGIHCPLIRIEHDRSPCVETRAASKDQLLEALRLDDSKSGKSRVSKSKVKRTQASLAASG